MIEKYSIRTDLALEDKERFESDNVEVQGVSLSEDYDEEREIKVTTVKIETENGAKVMRKPVGTYITMEAPNMAVPDEDYHAEISKELAKFLSRFIRKDKEDYSILVAGLGNRKVTPDALGPYVVDNLNITRHIVKEYGKYAMGEENVRFHDLRHTFSTMALQSGADVKTVANMLGHYSASFTLDTYTHVTVEMQVSAAEKIDMFMAAASGTDLQGGVSLPNPSTALVPIYPGIEKASEPAGSEALQGTWSE